MIKMTYDPIMGVRYIIGDEEYSTPHKQSLVTKLQEKYRRARHIRVKQMRRAHSTKSK